MRVERLSARTERAALDYLAQAPYDNVFLSYLVLFDRTAATRSALCVAIEDDRIRGVAHFGRQLALAADDAAIEAFGKHLPPGGRERTIVGPQATVRQFWDLVRTRHAPPRIVRERQLVMMIDRERLRLGDGNVAVRHARPDEWTAVADSSARMILQELSYDPRRTSSNFVANIRHMIARGFWWVGESNGELCFFCNVGPWCRQTAQLQGVWTPPELRGKGLATASLRAICDRLLNSSPTLSLHVNDFNTDAIALYRRVGFEHVSDYQTMIF